MGHFELIELERLYKGRSKMFFLWIRHFSGLFAPLSSNITREVCLYLSLLGCLADLSKDYIRFFSCDLGVWTRLVPHKTVQVEGKGTRWLLLDDLDVFACGGAEVAKEKQGVPAYWRSTYLVKPCGEVTELRPMVQCRAFHGLIQWQKCLFAFGGKGPACVNYLSNLQENEQYRLEPAPDWSSLPPMHKGRCCFNLCRYAEAIYLCGYGSQAIECYSPLRNCMTVVECQLPERTGACLYVQRNCLIVHSDNYILTYKTDAAGRLLQRGKVRIKVPLVKWQNSQPVLAKTLVYCISAGKVWSFLMDTGEIGPEQSP